MPILVKLLGKVILVNPLHPWNAELPILVKLEGRVVLVNPLHPWNAEFLIAVVLLSRVTLVVFLSVGPTAINSVPYSQ